MSKPKYVLVDSMDISCYNEISRLIAEKNRLRITGYTRYKELKAYRYEVFFTKFIKDR
jgi:hypothetical protein